MKFSTKQLGKSFAKVLFETKTTEDKQALIKELAHILVSEGKTSRLKTFKDAFSKNWEKLTGEVDVLIETSSEDGLHFPSEINGTKLSVRKKINPSLLAGLKIKIGDTEIDNTLKTKIRKLAQVTHH